MVVVEIDVMQIRDTEYISVQDAARYLHLTCGSVYYCASRGKLKIEQVEARWLLEWKSIQAFEREYPHKHRANYEVKIVRPALPQV